MKMVFLNLLILKTRFQNDNFIILRYSVIVILGNHKVINQRIVYIESLVYEKFSGKLL